MNQKEIYDNVLRELEFKNGNTKEEFVTPEVIQAATEKYVTGAEGIMLPVKAGRSSEPENSSSGSFSKNTALMPDFPIEQLKILEYLAVYNRHISYAVDNIISMANTEFKISFPDAIPEKMQKKMMDEALSCLNSSYEYSDGVTSLINDFLAQAAINGAISFENIVHDRIKEGIRKVVRVSPKTVRFVYDDESDSYAPHQIVLGIPKKNQVLNNGLIALNPRTYRYIAMRRFNESPYAVPPFLSALEDLITENDMIGNFKVMMKKMGILGFLSVLVKAPGKVGNETPAQYTSRLNDYLDTIEPQVSKQMSNSIAIGYKDQHEFKLEGNNLNSQNAENLIKLIKSFVYAGIKQDPNMHGENYSVTETFGRVILGKMSTQMENYQKAVASALEFIVITHLMLKGYYPEFVQVTFKKPMVGDEKKAAETEKLNIENVKLKYDMGIISQITAAQELGYEKPDKKEPRVATAVPGTKPGDNGNPSNTSPDNKTSADKILSMSKKIGAEITEFDYSIPEGCEEENFDFRNRMQNKFSKEYNTEVGLIYKKSADKAAKNAADKVRNTPGTMDADRFRNIVQIEVLATWSQSFIPEIKPVVKMNVNEMYRAWRVDKKPFIDAKSRNSNSFNLTSFISDVPEATFDLLDYRAIDFFEDNDNIYLGKFITDKDTQQRVKDFIDDWYLRNSAPIGDNTELLAQFEREFSDVLMMEAWKARRVIDTTVNKIRNYGNIAYLNQAKIESYEIVEIMDQKTCQWCATMNGKEFSVVKNAELIRNVTSLEPQDGVTLTPFATSVKIDEFKLMSNAEIQAKGMSIPAFHCNCRGRVVAVV